MNTTDEELVRSTLNGDKTAFSTPVRKYQRADYGESARLDLRDTQALIDLIRYCAFLHLY